MPPRSERLCEASQGEQRTSFFLKKASLKKRCGKDSKVADWGETAVSEWAARLAWVPFPAGLSNRISNYRNLVGEREGAGRLQLPVGWICCSLVSSMHPFFYCIFFFLSFFLPPLEIRSDGKHDPNIAWKYGKALQTPPRLSLLVANAPKMVIMKCNSFWGKKSS